MKQLVVVVMTLVTACGKGSGGDGKGSSGAGGEKREERDECAAAIDHMTSLQKGALAKEVPEAQRQKIEMMMARTAQAIAASCRETKWSKEALACLHGIQSLAQAKQCDDKITPEQRKAAEQAGEQAMKDAQKEALSSSSDDKAAAPSPEGSASSPVGDSR